MKTSHIANAIEIAEMVATSPSQLDDAKAEHAALLAVAEAARRLDLDALEMVAPSTVEGVRLALANLAAVKGGGQ